MTYEADLLEREFRRIEEGCMIDFLRKSRKKVEEGFAPILLGKGERKET